MKKTTTVFATFMFACILWFSNGIIAQNSSYQCVLQHDTLINTTTFQFDIFIYPSNSSTIYLNNFQLSFLIPNSSTLINGGKLSGLYVAGSSQLPTRLLPSGAVVITKGDDKYIRLNGPFPGICGVRIPARGLKIGTFQMVNTMNYVQKPNLTWHNSLPATTIIKAVNSPDSCGTVVDITDMGSHSILETGLTTFNNESIDLSVYPNPTKGICHFECSQYKIKTIEVFNTLGEKIIEENIGNKETTLDLELPAGVYYAQIIFDEGIVVKKIIRN